MRSPPVAESPPPVAVKVGDGLAANPDSGAKGFSAEGVAELTLDSVCPGDSVNYPAAGGFPSPYPRPQGVAWTLTRRSGIGSCRRSSSHLALGTDPVAHNSHG
jgi:hypothetical protein